MTENKKKARNGAVSTPAEGKKAASGKNKVSDTNDEIIELSDITVGTSPEDEVIIELTEGLVGAAIEGVSRATGKMDSEEKILDLSPGGKTAATRRPPATPDEVEDQPVTAAEDMDIIAGDTVDSIEEEIAKELDNYFKIEEQTQDLLNQTIPKQETAPISLSEFDLGKEFSEGKIEVTPDQFESALERVIQKMFADKIDRILNDVIERVVTEDIERLKEYLLKRRQ